jgi:hypothetical protein
MSAHVMLCQGRLAGAACSVKFRKWLKPTTLLAEPVAAVQLAQGSKRQTAAAGPQQCSLPPGNGITSCLEDKETEMTDGANGAVEIRSCWVTGTFSQEELQLLRGGGGAQGLITCWVRLKE